MSWPGACIGSSRRLCEDTTSVALSGPSGPRTAQVATRVPLSLGLESVGQ